MSNPRAQRTRFRRLVLFLKRHRLAFLGVIPLGVVLPVIFFMASLGPSDAAKNISQWPAAIGWDAAATWILRHASGPRILWATVILCLIYGAIVWGLPALVYRTRKQTAVILVPVAALLIVACVGVGAFMIGQQKLDWGLTQSQRDDVIQALKATNEKFPVAIGTVPAAPSDALAFAYDLMNHVFFPAGWGQIAVGVVGVPEYHPDSTGLLIAYRANTNPEENRKARALKAALDKTGFRVWYAGFNNFPENETMLVIGKTP